MTKKYKKLNKNIININLFILFVNAKVLLSPNKNGFLIIIFK